MSFNNFFYNLSEYALSRLFRVITGIELKYREKLDEILIYPLDETSPKIMNIVKEKIWHDFEINVTIMSEIIELPPKVMRGNFIITTDAARIIDEKIKRPEGTAILCVTKYAITPLPFLFTRIMQTIFPILGTSYILYGICFITTLKERLPQKILEYAATHEIGHLLGKHGYPVG